MTVVLVKTHNEVRMHVHAIQTPDNVVMHRLKTSISLICFASNHTSSVQIKHQRCSTSKLYTLPWDEPLTDLQRHTNPFLNKAFSVKVNQAFLSTVLKHTKVLGAPITYTHTLRSCKILWVLPINTSVLR